MPGPIARQIYELGNVQQAPGDTIICRYLPLWKFESMVTDSSLYLTRLDAFNDQLEGKLPQAIWELHNDAMQEWYAANREHVFVSCWHLSDTESPAMWREYAEGRGVIIYSTVNHLRAELSTPQLPPPPTLPEQYTILANTPGVNLVHYEPPEHDGFTTGIVEYIDREKIDVYRVMSEELSNTTPMFRKARDYIHELEYRAILRPGSLSVNQAHTEGRQGVNLSLNLEALVKEIRYSPVGDRHFLEQLENLFKGRQVLRDRLQPSTLGASTLL